jgi:hypothetical protein
MKRHIFLSLILSLSFSPFLLGQNFLTPVGSLTGDASTLTKDGKAISGDIRMAVFGTRGLKSFTIRDESGNKHKFQAEDIATLKVKVDGWAKLEMMSEKTMNLNRMVNADFDEIAEREFIIYEQVQVPGKNKYVLAQLLNPGWDRKIKVYHNPIGAETQQVGIAGVPLAGGDARNYIVIANEQASIILRKSKYEKTFSQIFANCPDMEENFQGRDRKFKHFASHVFAYDQGCE